MRKSIYLDFASATPIDPRVLTVYTKTAKVYWANPSALHKGGVVAKQALEEARIRVAQVLEVLPHEIVFTSGGTEGDNLAVLGVLRDPSVQSYLKGAKPHIIVSAIEHAAIIETAKALEKEGIATVSYAPVTSQGIIDIDAFKKLLRPETVLVSIMYANNEIGTVQPIRELAKSIRHFRKMHTEKVHPLWPYFHTDATQAANYLSLRVPSLGVDLMTLNGSKIYGPKGTGALFVSKSVAFGSLFHGGLQEGNRRPGTENVAGSVAFSEALTITQKMKEKEVQRLRKLQTFFFTKLKALFPDIEINGSQDERLPNNVHVTFPGLESETLMLYLDARGISVSEKSACKSESEEPSHVIGALGKKDGGRSGGIRFSLGRTTTKNDIIGTLKALEDIRALLHEEGLAR